VNYIDEIAAAIRSKVPSDALPEEDSVEDLFRLYALLSLVKGAEVSAEDVHNAWSTWMAREEPNHESLRPFDELDASTRRDDMPYVEAIRAVAKGQDERS
jgi:hypothetical protein